LLLRLRGTFQQVYWLLLLLLLLSPVVLLAFVWLNLTRWCMSRTWKVVGRNRM